MCVNRCPHFISTSFGKVVMLLSRCDQVPDDPPHKYTKCSMHLYITSVFLKACHLRVYFSLRPPGSASTLSLTGSTARLEEVSIRATNIVIGAQGCGTRPRSVTVVVARCAVAVSGSPQGSGGGHEMTRNDRRYKRHRTCHRRRVKDPARGICIADISRKH